VSFSVTPSGDPGESLTPSSCTLPATAAGPNRCSATLMTATPDTYKVAAAYSGDQRYRQGSARTTVKVK
jgi:hypothetical protein